jgi:hypothetical protein
MSPATWIWALDMVAITQGGYLYSLYRPRAAVRSITTRSSEHSSPLAPSIGLPPSPKPMPPPPPSLFFTLLALQLTPDSVDGAGVVLMVDKYIFTRLPAYDTPVRQMARRNTRWSFASLLYKSDCRTHNYLC